MRCDIHQAAINELDRQPAMRDQMHWHARRIAVIAKRAAPVWSGQYRRSINATRVPGSRAVAWVVSTDRKALLMEYGSKHNKPFHTLRDAAKRGGYLVYERVVRQQ